MVALPDGTFMILNGAKQGEFQGICLHALTLLTM